MYEAKVVESSRCLRSGMRILSVEAEYPRIVLAEAVTHRKVYDAWGYAEWETAERTTTADMSKNSASSRAIPTAAMIRKVMTDPYVPERFGIDGRGMQSRSFAEGRDHEELTEEWMDARDQAVIKAMSFLTADDVRAVVAATPEVDTPRILGFVRPKRVRAHKEYVNRLLEPFLWVRQLLTATWDGWANFFTLRTHADAHPALQKMARMAYLAFIDHSGPRHLNPGEWHLPYVRDAEKSGFFWTPETDAPLPDLIRHSAARCAWLSYENHNRDGSAAAMDATYARLISSRPVHASPVEHQATPEPYGVLDAFPELRGNLRGYVQARKLVPLEHAADFQPGLEEIASWRCPA